jgi:hypothetical protein
MRDYDEDYEEVHDDDFNEDDFNDQQPYSDWVMPFGKHRGRLLRNVPADYLAWCVRTLTDLNPRMRQAMRYFLRRQGWEGPEAHDGFKSRESRRHEARGESRRQEAEDAVDVRAVVTSWYREMALKHHPDRGGSTEVMAAINDGVERLRQMLGLR